MTIGSFRKAILPQPKALCLGTRSKIGSPPPVMNTSSTEQNQLDLTPYLDYEKENVIAVRLDNPPDSSRWYPGSGIYRNVWLIKISPVHIAHWGTTVTTPSLDGKYPPNVDVRVAVENDSPAAAK